MDSSLYTYSPAVHSRWSSFENPTAEKGKAAQANNGLKGAAFAPVAAGESVVLLDTKGSGIIRRIWMTVANRTPNMLRSLRLDFYWDSAPTPAVSVPLSDFFGVGLGRVVPFECEYFASPEGKSFTCFIPMPFRSAARVVLTNESSVNLTHLFYDIAFTVEPVADSALYFHAAFRREQPTTLGRDFEILPRVNGRGRFLGVNFGVVPGPAYKDVWWGEGEVKFFLDGDIRHPTLCNTGAEDYVSTGWGLGGYSQRFHGSTVADGQNDQWCFYRFHGPDPIVFHSDCRATFQQPGGGPQPKVVQLLRDGIRLRPITADANGRLIPLPETMTLSQLADLPATHWINFLREDDVSATAYFYLDRPENGLPALADVASRVHSLFDVATAKRTDGGV